MWERQLIAAVIFKAICDYKTCTKDVQVFFKSKWGQYICEHLDLSAEMILEKLENNEIKINRHPNGRLIQEV